MIQKVCRPPKTTISAMTSGSGANNSGAHRLEVSTRRWRTRRKWAGASRLTLVGITRHATFFVHFLKRATGQHASQCGARLPQWNNGIQTMPRSGTPPVVRGMLPDGSARRPMNHLTLIEEKNLAIRIMAMGVPVASDIQNADEPERNLGEQERATRPANAISVA